MPSRQRKTCRRVIEVRAQPGIGAMAVVACAGKTGYDVIRTRSCLKILEVARSTGRRHRLKLAGRPAFVARVAIDDGMRSGERKTVVMILNLLHRDLPSADAMALFAIGSQLPPVNVSVAILATLSHIGEDWFYVTAGTGDGLVQSAQWVACLVVIKFRNAANGFPGIRGVAVLAGHTQFAVRTVRSGRRLRPG